MTHDEKVKLLVGTSVEVFKVLYRNASDGALLVEIFIKSLDAAEVLISDAELRISANNLSDKN